MMRSTYLRMSKLASATPSVRATQGGSIAISKRGKYWHYEFMIDAQFEAVMAEFRELKAQSELTTKREQLDALPQHQQRKSA